MEKRRAIMICLLTSISATPLLSFAAKEVVDTKVKLSCSVSGVYADGSAIKTSGVEDISVDIRRINWNKDEPSKPPAWGSVTNIKVTSNGKPYEASLLRSTRDQVAFSFASDTTVDRIEKTLAFTYELTLSKPKLKRTTMSLFSVGSNSISTSEGDCSISSK